MGQKVNPLILRIGFIKNWNSIWFAKKKDYAKFIEEDFKIRKFIKARFKQAAVAKIVIERVSDRVKIKIHSARPGIIIGRHGQDIERLREDLNSLVKREISIDIEEVTEPFLEVSLIAENIAFQLEKRVAFRRAMKRAMEQAMSSGAKGIKISCGGRLGGAEIARTENARQGKVPLQTLRADIDFHIAEALTTFGLIGVKVWLYRGDVMPQVDKKVSKEEQQTSQTIEKEQ